MSYHIKQRHLDDKKSSHDHTSEKVATELMDLVRPLSAENDDPPARSFPNGETSRINREAITARVERFFFS